MNAMETRKLAQELGFKNVAKFSKVELEAMIAEARAKVAKALETESEKKVAKLQKARRVRPIGKCTDCGRKADPNSPSDNRLCSAHLEQAEWENAHMNGHEGAPDGTEPNGDGSELPTCWICHPELDETKPASDRKGTSRLGMRMTVPVRGSAVEKVSAVQAKLAALPAEDVSVNVAFPEGTELVEMGITYGSIKIVLAWFADSGTYAYDHTMIQESANHTGRKARNVSAALRALGI